MITYSLSGTITISDDRDASRPPLVLPAGTTSVEVGAAAASYLGPANDLQSSDYVAFYDSLLISAVYQSALTQPATADLVRAMLVFATAIQESMNGRENRPAMQAAIWILLSQVALQPQHVAELTGLMIASRLASVYQLQPPTP